MPPKSFGHPFYGTPQKLGLLRFVSTALNDIFSDIFRDSVFVNETEVSIALSDADQNLVIALSA